MSDCANSNGVSPECRVGGSSNTKRQCDTTDPSSSSPTDAGLNSKKKRAIPRWSLESVETDATAASFVSSRSSVSDDYDKKPSCDRSDNEDDEIEAGSDNEIGGDSGVDNSQADSDEEPDDSDDEYAGSEAGCYRIDYNSVPCDILVLDRRVLAINRERPSIGFPELIMGTGVGLDKLPEELKFIIQTYVLALEPRTIYLGWDHNAAAWSYNHSGNQIPRAPPAFSQSEDGSANKTLFAYPYLLPAPQMSNMPYLYFDYDVDILHIEYTRCGNSNSDQREHNSALDDALVFLRIDTHAPTRLKFLTIEYCMNCLRPDDILVEVAHFSALKVVTLRQHDHYCKNATENNITAEGDFNFIASEAGNLDSGEYSFQVKVVDHTNEPIKG